MEKLELRLPPPLVALTTALMMGLQNHYLPINFSLPGSRYLILLLTLVGICLGVIGVIQFRAAQTTIHPTHPDRSAHLVTDGIYRYSRNPMYLGLLLLLIAWAIYLNSVISPLFVVLFVFYMNRFQIIPEERALKEKFEDKYQRYFSQVRRWI